MGSDGRTAYERITSHVCKVAQIGFAETVDFKVETDKNDRRKADSEFAEGVFLGYAWRSTEYLVAVGDHIYQCRTVKRRADEIAYNHSLIENLNVRFEDFVLKGARTTAHVHRPKAAGGDSPDILPTRGTGIIPRRMYLKPSDFAVHGFTQGCPDCIFAQTGIGPKRNHSDACRQRMEAEIGKDASDDRAAKVKERQDRYLAQRIREADEEMREDDPRHEEVVEEPKAEHESEEVVTNVVDQMDCVDSPAANREDDEIRYRAILGADMSEVQ